MSHIKFIFDFDNTLVNVDVDSIITRGFTNTSKYWCDHMDYVLRELTLNDVYKRISTIFSPVEIPDNSIIVSDSNDLFINFILGEQSHKILEMHCNKYSHPGMKRYVESHDCMLCKHKPNMCKGDIIELLVEKYSEYKLIFVGDGNNDICAVKHLRPCDEAFIRKGYPLDIEEFSAYKKWNSYNELNKLIKESLSC
jgi:hypothetical protein